jgi:hypothetical protein
MSLFEKSGIILRFGEEIIKRGRVKGKVPKGVKLDVSAWTISLPSKGTSR